MIRIVFWQNFQNHHQSAHINALATRSGVEVVLVTQKEFNRERQSIGWSPPVLDERVRKVIAPPPRVIDQLLTEAESESVHIFSGMRAYPMVRDAFHRGLYTNVRLYVMSEAYEWIGPLGLARVARGRWEARRYKNRIDGILGIGHLGVRWFEMSGYDRARVYPYGYFTEKPLEEMPETQQRFPDRDNTFNMVFIGRCLPTKGLDILLKTLQSLRDLNWRLTIIGDGPQRRMLEALTDSLGLTGKVQFVGVLPHGEAMSSLAASDLLVLPSRWDGWGAVVNEALMRGIPVVCSDHCGAAVLLGSPERGTTFPARSREELAAALRQRMAEGKRTLEQARVIRAWSRNIEGEAAADYLLDVLAHAPGHGGEKPVPPWLS